MRCLGGCACGVCRGGGVGGYKTVLLRYDSAVVNERVFLRRLQSYRFTQISVRNPLDYLPRKCHLKALVPGQAKLRPATQSQ